MNESVKTTKKVLRKESKWFLIKSFTLPQVPVAGFMYLLSRIAYQGHKLDVARHGTPILGEWNQLKMALGVLELCLIVGLVFLAIAVVYVLLTKNFHFVDKTVTKKAISEKKSLSDDDWNY